MKVGSPKVLSAQETKINLMSLICFVPLRRSVLWDQISKQSGKNSQYSGEDVLPEGVLKGFS